MLAGCKENQYLFGIAVGNMQIGSWTVIYAQQNLGGIPEFITLDNL